MLESDEIVQRHEERTKENKELQRGVQPGTTLQEQSHQAIKPAAKRFREKKKFTSQQTVTHSRATTMGTMQMFGMTADQTMVLPEGVEISFELGGVGGRSSSNN